MPFRQWSIQYGGSVDHTTLNYRESGTPVPPSASDDEARARYIDGLLSKRAESEDAK